MSEALSHSPDAPEEPINPLSIAQQAVAELGIQINTNPNASPLDRARVAELRTEVGRLVLEANSSIGIPREHLQ